MLKKILSFFTGSNLHTANSSSQMANSNQTNRSIPNTDTLSSHLDKAIERRNIIFKYQQPNDSSYGYSLSNPICTSTINSSDRYLARLRTSSGVPFYWLRKGSVCKTDYPGIDSVMVDVYQLYLDWEPFCELYICPYGHDSLYVPSNLLLASTNTEMTSRDIAREAYEHKIDVDEYIALRCKEAFFHQSGKNQTTSFSELYKENMSMRVKVQKNLGITADILTPTKNLAISTFLIADELPEKHSRFLCKTNLTRFDVIVFAAFIMRAFCIGGTSNREKSQAFSNEYLDLVCAGIGNTCMSLNPSYRQCIFERFSCYDSILVKSDPFDERINQIIDLFSFNIKSDIVHGKYIPYSSDSPMPVWDIDDEIKCYSEAMELFRNIPTLVAPYYDQVLSELE